MLDLTLPTPPIAPPSRFLLEETIVEGVFTSTYRARDLVVGNVVTLTQVAVEQAGDAVFLARFEREIALLATITAPNIVRVTASGNENGIPYVATEHVAGRDLATEIGERGPMSPRDAIAMARQVLAGLGAIHAAGMLHLRLTPHSLMLGDDGTARVTGVGIAGLSASDDRSNRGSGVAVTRYLAPELIEGGNVSEATDLYALGAVLFEALTGQPPFPGTNPVLVRFAQLHAPPPRPSQHTNAAIPPALDDAIVRALAKDPGQRFVSATEMAAAINAEEVGMTIDRIVEQTTVSVTVASTPGAATWPQPPFAEAVVQAPVAPRVPRTRKRTTSAGWVWPMSVAIAAIALLIVGLAASLAGEPKIDEVVAGVSTFEPDPTKRTTNLSGAASIPTATATVRVVRESTDADEAEPTKKQKRPQTPTVVSEE